MSQGDVVWEHSASAIMENNNNIQLFFQSLWCKYSDIDQNDVVEDFGEFMANDPGTVDDSDWNRVIGSSEIRAYQGQERLYHRTETCPCSRNSGLPDVFIPDADQEGWKEGKHWIDKKHYLKW